MIAHERRLEVQLQQKCKNQYGAANVIDSRTSIWTGYCRITVKISRGNNQTYQIEQEKPAKLQRTISPEEQNQIYNNKH